MVKVFHQRMLANGKTDTQSVSLQGTTTMQLIPGIIQAGIPSLVIRMRFHMTSK